MNIYFIKWDYENEENIVITDTPEHAFVLFTHDSHPDILEEDMIVVSGNRNWTCWNYCRHYIGTLTHPINGYNLKAYITEIDFEEHHVY